MPKKIELSAADKALRERLGSAIRQAASDRGIKPQEIARITGVSLAQQYRVENGEATPDALYLFKVASHLGISLDVLLGLSQVPSPIAPDEEILLDNYRNSPPEDQADLKVSRSPRTPAQHQMKSRKPAA